MVDRPEPPQRSCIGCREVRPREELVRFVRAPDGALLVDYRHRLPGRGAYTCIRLECVTRALSRRQFDRAFKLPCRALTALELAAALEAALVRRLEALLGMARKSSQLFAGGNRVLDALGHPGELAAVILADDISVGVAEKVSGKAAGGGVPVLRFASKTGLGRLLGRGELSVAALLKGPLAAVFMAEWQKYQDITAECAGDI